MQSKKRRQFDHWEPKAEFFIEFVVDASVLAFSCQELVDIGFYFQEFVIVCGDAIKTQDLNRIETTMHFSATGKRGQAFIISEAHGDPKVARVLSAGRWPSTSGHAVQEQLPGDVDEDRSERNATNAQKTQHTPTPWVASEHDDNKDIVVRDRDWQVVANCTVDFCGGKAQAKANARRVCRVVDSYDTLAETCRAMRDRLAESTDLLSRIAEHFFDEDDGPTKDVKRQVIENIAAIAHAKKRGYK